MKRTTLFSAVATIAVWMLFATTANAASGKVNFELTVEQQFLLYYPINETTARSTIIKFRLTTKDMLNIIGTHYAETYALGAYLSFGVMNEGTEDQVGVLEVSFRNPDGTIVTVREIDPEVFTIDSKGLLEEDPGQWGEIYEGTWHYLYEMYINNSKTTTFLSCILNTEDYDLTLTGILRSNSSKSLRKQRNPLTLIEEQYLTIRSSGDYTVLGEGFIDSVYAVASGKVTVRDESFTYPFYVE